MNLAQERAQMVGERELRKKFATGKEGSKSKRAGQIMSNKHKNTHTASHGRIRRSEPVTREPKMPTIQFRQKTARDNG